MRLLKRVVPGEARRWLRHIIGWRWLRGDYATWAEAKAASGGYDDPAILDRVRNATRAVRDGRAAWERDGAVFREPWAHEPLLDVLRHIAAVEGGKLEIVDFGGALGSTLWQHRAWLADLVCVRWRVVEQPGLVAVGQAEFADAVLSFHPTLDEAGPAPAVLFSSVLQYIENPHAMLEEVVRRGYRHVIIDRTGFSKDGRERIAVQFTPPALGGGNYPCRIFDQARLLEPLGKDYILTKEWPVEFDRLDRRVDYRGFYFQRRQASS